jgi:hypothetical protein
MEKELETQLLEFLEDTKTQAKEWENITSGEVLLKLKNLEKVSHELIKLIYKTIQ